MAQRLIIWLRGVRHAWEQGGELTSGYTFDNDPESPLSRAYDRGANLGEWLHARTHR